MPTGRSPHFIIIPKLRLTYGRIPKVAATSIRATLLRYVTRDPAYDLKPSSDAFWQQATLGETFMATADTVLDEYSEFFSFAFVRNPFDRLYSCYNNKVIENRTLGKAFERAGIVLGMPFPEFVEKIAVVPDEHADVHFCSQAHMIVRNGSAISHFVGYYEQLARDWEKLRGELRRRGIAAAKLPTKNVRRRDKTDYLHYLNDPQLCDMIRDRYHRDFEIFYPELLHGNPLERL